VSPGFCHLTLTLKLRIWCDAKTNPFLLLVRASRSILNEVGRVDQLADLPIDVGVPDDGLLVGKSMEGNVGLILCSFLEPLR
jgi:hypothetical protein